MDIYSVGKDRMSDWWFDDIEHKESYRWIVYAYECYGDDGSGHAVAYREFPDGTSVLYCKDLAHCSCYGPIDNWEDDCVKLSVEDFFHGSDSIFDYQCEAAIRNKVRQLVGKR